MNYAAIGPEGFHHYAVQWSSEGPSFERVSEPADHLLAPGFVDLHIHGGFGIDFMSATADEMGILCRGLAKEGYEAFLPTTVTASREDVEQALLHLPDSPMTPGFHLEGPFISPARPGAQPAAWIQEPPAGPSEWDAVLEHPKLKLITLAPERPHALELASRLFKRGVCVNMGHTDATFDEARRGYEFGARGATHTFNAMREFHQREVGIVGYCLANPDLYCELIYDGKHVCREAADLLIRSKPNNRLIAVSDGTKAIGLPPGERVDMWGYPAIVGKGEVRTAEGDALAGSAITLLDAFRNLCRDFGPELAIRACCLNPRSAIGLSHPPSVWLEFDSGLKLIEIHKTGDAGLLEAGS